VIDVRIGKALWAGAVVAAVTLGMAGCVSSDADPVSPSPEPEAADVYSGEPLPELPLEEVPLAGDPTYAEADRSAVEGIAAGRLLATKPGDVNVIMLDAYDTSSGELAWDITTGEAAQLVLDAGFGAGRVEFAAGALQRGGDLYVAPLFSNATASTPYRSGLIAVNAADGSVAWTADLSPHLGDDVDGISVHADVVDASPETVIANVEAQTTQGERVSVAIALDASSGEVRWAERGVVLSSVAGDVVTAIRTASPGDDHGSLVGLTASTGEEAWSAGDASGEWIGGVGGLVAAWTPEAALFESSTGAPVDAGAILSAPVAGADFVAWLNPDDQALVTYTGGDERSWPGAEQVAADDVVAIDDAGYVWLASGAQVTAYDRTGAARTDPLPGAFAGARDGSVVTVEDDGAVHLWGGA